MARHRAHAIESSLLAIGLAVALSSCGGATHHTESRASPSSASGGSQGTPVTTTSTSAISPSPGAKSTRTSAISTSPEAKSTSTSAISTSVPNVDSEPVPVAMLNLEQADLTVGTQKPEPNLDVPQGSVITTDPAVGTQLSAGAAINLLVSAGPPQCGSCRNRDTAMPNLIGQTLQQAKTMLAESGFTLYTYSFQKSPQPRGIIIQSNPTPGTFASIKYGVTLVLSLGPVGSPSVSPTTAGPTVSSSTTAPSASPSALPETTIPAPG
jgi:PASTA domain